MYIEEDTTADNETTHAAETVGLVLASKPMTLVTDFRSPKSACVPKDLPGMWWCYALCVSGTSSRTYSHTLCRSPLMRTPTIQWCKNVWPCSRLCISNRSLM